MRWMIVGALGIFSAALIASDGFADYTCATLADCRREAEADIAAGRYEHALEPLVAVTDFATGASDDRQLLFAFESLTSMNLTLGRPLKAHAWAQAAVKRFPQDQQALNNLERAKKALPPLPPNAFDGIYESYAGYGYWSELKIAEQSQSRFRTEWSMMRFGLVPSAWAYGPAAFWDLSAEARYSDGSFVVRYEGMSGAPCELGFKRNGLAIEWIWPRADELSQDCRIGGANVFPWGPFWLVDTAIPTFSD